VLLARLDSPDAPLPAPLLEDARQAVAKMDAATTDAYQRQAAVNAAANLYWEAGLDEDANRLLTAELQKSKSPLLTSCWTSRISRKGGPQAGGVQWLERAYAGAKGPATRFQWGYNYLVGLLE
jgi:protein disulfide-isomerase